MSEESENEFGVLIRWNWEFVNNSRGGFQPLLLMSSSSVGSGIPHSLRTDGFRTAAPALPGPPGPAARLEGRLEEVTGDHGLPRHYAEADHQRTLVTIFGEVRVRRLAYRHKGTTNLCPADAALNLPEETYSHGLRAIAATGAARGSFDEAVAAIDRAGAVAVPKRQVEELAQAAAVDFEAFFAEAERPEPDDDDQVVVLSADGKGVVMRPEGLRAATEPRRRPRRTS